ncbi:hypothetical protein ACFLX3_02125 [Chloroflexota bacterium]
MWGSGFATGIGIGFVLGLVVGGLGVKQKPWSELTLKEKKTRKILTGVLVFLALLGVVAFLWIYF